MFFTNLTSRALRKLMDLGVFQETSTNSFSEMNGYLPISSERLKEAASKSGCSVEELETGHTLIMPLDAVENERGEKPVLKLHANPHLCSVPTIIEGVSGFRYIWALFDERALKQTFKFDQEEKQIVDLLLPALISSLDLGLLPFFPYPEGFSGLVFMEDGVTLDLKDP